MATTLQSQLPAPSQHSLRVPKQGSLLKFMGGLSLAASFFLPVLKNSSNQSQNLLSLLSTIQFTDPMLYLFVGIVPIFYTLGLTTVMLVVFGRFTQRGISRGLVRFHIFEMILVILASGAGLLMALTKDHRFATFMVGPALLAWLALFVNFIATWLTKSQSLMWRVVRSTQLSGAFNFLIFGLVVLDTLYNQKQRVELGLWMAAAGSFLLMIGNEPKRTPTHR